MGNKFKIEDKIYHIQYGWGEVKNVSFDLVNVIFNDGANITFNFKLKSLLSFTEYTLDGFSQDRPEPLPNKGDIVWVRDREYDNWMITYFMKRGCGEMKYGTNPRKSDDSAHCYYYRYLTTENPYEDEKQG